MRHRSCANRKNAKIKNKALCRELTIFNATTKLRGWLKWPVGDYLRKSYRFIEF